MNKQIIVQKTIVLLKQDLASVINAAQQAHDAATHDQSKAETQYDTLGLENAYLAEGLSRRIDELNQAISLLENWNIPEFNEDDDIYLGALLHLQPQAPLSSSHSKKPATLCVLLAPAGGGRKIELKNEKVLIITPQSPMGEALLGLGLDDIAKLENGQHFQIIQFQ